MEHQGQISLEAVSTVWRRRRWLAVPVFAAGVAITAALASSLPSLYRATATLLVEGQQVPEQLVRTTVTGALDTRLQAITREIFSWAKLGELIVRLDLYPDLRKAQPPEAVIEAMNRDVRLERKLDPTLRGSLAFAISYQGPGPETTAQVTNMLASLYVEENMRGRERQASTTTEFLRVELAEKRKRLEELEGRLTSYKKRHQGELPGELQASVTTLERLSAELRQTSDKLRESRARREALDRLVGELGEVEVATQMTIRSMPGSPERVVPPRGGESGADPVHARIAQLREELSVLLSQFTEKHPDVVRLRAELAMAERRQEETRQREQARQQEEAAEQKRKGEQDARAGAPALKPASASGAVGDPVSLYRLQLRQVAAQLGAEIGKLEAEETRLRADQDLVRRRVESAPIREAEIRELSRDHDVATRLYASLQSRHEEAQMAENLEQRQKGEMIRILDPAVTPRAPATPKRAILLLVGVALSLGLAVGVAIAAEWLDSSIHTVDELRALTKVPILGSVAPIVTEDDARRRSHRQWFGAAAVSVGAVVVAGATIFLAQGNMDLVRMLATLRL